MLNAIFAALIVGSVAWAAISGHMEEVMQASIDSAKGAVEVAIGLIGMMALWLGLMRVLRDAGVMHSISRGLAPVMSRLFPDIPADHPAMGAMIMNIAANMMGLGNAATPFGLKAMQELNRLNDRPGVATNSMALFLAINTSGVAVFPTGVIALRASLGSADAGGILVPSILATLCSTATGIAVAIALSKRRAFRIERYQADAPLEAEPDSVAPVTRQTDELDGLAGAVPPTSRSRLLLLAGFFLLMIGGLVWRSGNAEAGEMGLFQEVMKFWLLPVLMATIVLYGYARHVKVYESVVKGAREGFDIFVMIIPFLVAILVAIGMFRASGALDLFIGALQPLTSLISFPAEALPMALLRPLSGGGAYGVLTESLTSYGPDSFVGYLVSVLNGSTETTFYVLAVYFGSVRIRAARHTVIACLSADAAGILAAFLWCRVFFS